MVREPINSYTGSTGEMFQRNILSWRCSEQNKFILCCCLYIPPVSHVIDTPPRPYTPPQQAWWTLLLNGRIWWWWRGWFTAKKKWMNEWKNKSRHFFPRWMNSADINVFLFGLILLPTFLQSFCFSSPSCTSTPLWTAYRQFSWTATECKSNTSNQPQTFYPLTLQEIATKPTIIGHETAYRASVPLLLSLWK